MTAADSTRPIVGVPVTISVLANDAGAGLRIIDHTQPIAGTLTLNADQTFTYLPADGFEGVDNFTCTVRDPIGGTASADVTVVVRGGSSAATVVGDAVG